MGIFKTALKAVAKQAAMVAAIFVGKKVLSKVMESKAAPASKPKAAAKPKPATKSKSVPKAKAAAKPAAKPKAAAKPKTQAKPRASANLQTTPVTPAKTEPPSS